MNPLVLWPPCSSPIPSPPCLQPLWLGSHPPCICLDPEIQPASEEEAQEQGKEGSQRPPPAAALLAKMEENLKHGLRRGMRCMGSGPHGAAPLRGGLSEAGSGCPMPPASASHDWASNDGGMGGGACYASSTIADGAASSRGSRARAWQVAVVSQTLPCPTLLRALRFMLPAPASGCLEMCRVGAEEVGELGAAVGQTLTSLHLKSSRLQPSFWAALWEHLPQLQRLSLHAGCRGLGEPEQLLALCTAAPRALRIEGAFEDWGRQQLGELQQALHRLPGCRVEVLRMAD